MGSGERGRDRVSAFFHTEFKSNFIFYLCVCGGGGGGGRVWGVDG